MPLAVLANSRDLAVQFDLDGRTTYRNAALVARTPQDEALAANNFPAPHRELFLAAVATVIGGSSAAFEWGDTGPAGVRSWYAAEVTPYEGGGICISRDVTELKRSEQRFRRSEQLMVDTQGVAHLGTWEWDIAQPTATWSAELYRIYGLSPETYTPSYEHYLTLVHPDDRQRVIDATNRVFHEHVPYSHDERIRRPDGSFRYLHTWAYPVLDDTGKLTHLIGVCQDITDRATAEAALQQLNNELEDRVLDRTNQLETALREIDAFNSMVTHDLRSPVTVMKMTLDMFARETNVMTARTSEYLDRMRRASQNMSALIDSLLALATVAQRPLRVQEVDVSALCSDIVAELRAVSPEHRAEIAIEPNIRCKVDPSLFRAALVNLVSNAWKYSSQRAIAQIQLGTVKRPGGRSLFVHDDGIGFDMEHRQRMFAPFERLENASNFVGNGVGLTIVRKIIERHGGQVDAESAPGEGATFYVTLPDDSWLNAHT